METLDEIQKIIIAKFKSTPGVKLILEENINDKLYERISTSIKEAETILGSDVGQYLYLLHLNKSEHLGKTETTIKILDDILYAWLPSFFNDGIGRYSQLHFSDLYGELKRKGEVYLKERYDSYWKMINTSEKYLKSEDLSKVKKYFVNAVRGNLTFDRSNRTFTLVIYLISDSRIIIFSINDKGLIKSTEHLIQKDLKKIEIMANKDVVVYFHYHGLHDPDILYMDSYEAAVSLRKQITELRENKFNTPKRLVQ